MGTAADDDDDDDDEDRDRPRLDGEVAVDDEAETGNDVLNDNDNDTGGDDDEVDEDDGRLAKKLPKD